MKRSLAIFLLSSLVGCAATPVQTEHPSGKTTDDIISVLDVPQGAIDTLADDVDGDGKKDLIAVSHGANQAIVFKQGVPKKFVQSQVVKEVGFHPNGFVPWPDGNRKYLICAAEGVQQIQVYEKAQNGLLRLVNTVSASRPRAALPFHSKQYGESLAVLPYMGGRVDLLLGFDPLKGAEKTIHVDADSYMAGQLILAPADTGQEQGLLLPGTRADKLWNIGGPGSASSGATALASFASPAVPVAATLADLNADGRPDIVVATALGRSAIRLINDGGGRYREAPPLSYSDKFYRNPTSIAYGLDRSGEAYLVMGGELDIKLWYYVPGSGAELLSWPSIQGQVEGMVNKLQLVDLDGDGWLDLVISQSGDSKFRNGVVIVFGPLKENLPKLQRGPKTDNK